MRCSLLCVVLMLTAACALFDEAPPYVEADSGQQLPDLDVADLADSPDMADMVDMSDDGPTCTPRACQPGQCGMVDDGCGQQISCGSPLTACPADACGMIPDGCGGMLDCGQCKCVGGQPTTSRCGTCELGLLRCEDDMPVCEDIPLPPGATIPCDSIVYVNSEGGAGGVGTKNSPLSNLNDAIEAAQQANKRLVLVAGEGTSAETLVLSDGVHVIAGFAPGSFARNPAQRPHINVPANPGGDTFGVSARSIVQPTVLSGLRITTADATAPSASNYGVYASSSPGLILHSLTVNTGRGGPGRDGAAGARGANGNAGEAGHLGYDAAFESTNLSAATLAANPQRGRAGTNAQCPQANGSGGGYGYGDSYDLDGNSSLPTAGGNSPGGGMGGAAGQNATGQRNGVNAPAAVNNAALASSGSGGMSTGTITNKLWSQLGDGEDGAAGAHGVGGGGGGGAYRCRYNETPAGEACPNMNNTSYGGPGGGGGGAGGCGGGGGKKGTGGGGAFGLFVLDSPMLRVVDASFTAAPGGVGGKGGIKGSGGDPGGGGNGSSRAVRLEPYNDNGSLAFHERVDTINRRGGNGAAGTKGLDGGNGGGGAGGVSYGAYCAGGQLRVEGLVTFMSAGAAPGGTVASMASGATGISADEHQCR